MSRRSLTDDRSGRPLGAWAARTGGEQHDAPGRSVRGRLLAAAREGAAGLRAGELWGAMRGTSVVRAVERGGPGGGATRGARRRDLHPREAWLQASGEFARRLLAPDADGLAPTDERHPLHLLAGHARRIARAAIVTVVLPGPGPDELRVVVADGDGAEQLVGLRLPVAGSLAGAVYTHGVPRFVTRPDRAGGPAVCSLGGRPVGPVLATPLLGPRRAHGVLTVARRRGARPFDVDDVDMAAEFANQASLALELAAARADRQRAEVLDERDRIASDLGEHVVRQLFATGLALHGVAAALGPGENAARVLHTAGEIDATIDRVRVAMLALAGPGVEVSRAGLRARLQEVLAAAAPALGVEPELRWFVPGGAGLPEPLAAELVEVLATALDRVAQRGGARSVSVELSLAEARLTLQVRDDGSGADGAGSALTALRERARCCGGVLSVTAAPSTGAVLTWTVPYG